MKVYDEDSFFGSGEREIQTVAEVLEFLNEEDQKELLRLCEKSDKRRKRESLFSIGYFEARSITNNYEGKGNQSNSIDYETLFLMEYDDVF